MGVGCKNASVGMVAMAVTVMLILMLMNNCVEEADAAAAAASVVEEMDMISFFSQPKSMAMGPGEQMVMAYDQGDEEFVEEITRRMLDSSQNSLGYNMLDRNRTPCSNPGQSAYNSNCNKPGNHDSPGKRDCTAATRCARSQA